MAEEIDQKDPIENDPTVRTINSLSFTARRALLDFAHAGKLDQVQRNTLERQGLIQLIPALTVRGCEIAEEGGWVWPAD